jgi:RHS repeat-associated protein
MPGRTDSHLGHRYGFNGKEMDNGVKGEGVQYDYGFRIYDARIARFLSVDPLTDQVPGLSPYQYAANEPLWAIDKDGEIRVIVTSYYENFDGSLDKVVTSYDVVLPDELLGITRYPIQIEKHYKLQESNRAGSITYYQYDLVSADVVEGSGETFIERLKRTDKVGYYSMKFVNGPLNLTQSHKFAKALIWDRSPENGRLFSKSEKVVAGVHGVISLALAGRIKSSKDVAKYIGNVIALEIGGKLLEEYALNEALGRKLGELLIENNLVDETYKTVKGVLSHVKIDLNLVNRLIERAGSAEELIENSNLYIAKNKGEAIKNAIKYP